MDAELGCTIVIGERGQPPNRYCYTCWKLRHTSPVCPLITDAKREAIALRREAAVDDRSRVTRFRPGLHE
jgi:hypothetical protein